MTDVDLILPRSQLGILPAFHVSAEDANRKYQSLSALCTYNRLIPSASSRLPTCKGQCACMRIIVQHVLLSEINSACLFGFVQIWMRDQRYRLKRRLLKEADSNHLLESRYCALRGGNGLGHQLVMAISTKHKAGNIRGTSKYPFPKELKCKAVSNQNENSFELSIVE